MTRADTGRMQSPFADRLIAAPLPSFERFPVIDLLLALPVAALEVGVLLLACLKPALERWGAREPSKPSLNRAYNVGLVSAALLPSVGACASFCMYLPFTTATQCVVAVCPTFVLGVVIVKSVKLPRLRRDRRDNA